MISIIELKLQEEEIKSSEALLKQYKKEREDLKRGEGLAKMMHSSEIPVGIAMLTEHIESLQSSINSMRKNHSTLLRLSIDSVTEEIKESSERLNSEIELLKSYSATPIKFDELETDEIINE